MVTVCIVAAVFLLLIGIYLFCIAPRCKTPELMKKLRTYRYAHRGYHDSEHGIPENSLAAFRRAIAHGFGAELDVHLSNDGRLVIMHDDSLQRTCGVDLNIEDLTSEDLAKYHLEGTAEPIPYLEDVLALFERKTPLIVEVKPVRGNYAALCAATCEMLDRYEVEYCIESFDPRAVRWLKKHRPELVRGQLAENYSKHGETLSAPLRFILHNLLLNFLTRPDFVAYRVEDRTDFSFRVCKNLMHAREFSWTVRNHEDQRVVENDGGVIIFEQFDPTKA